MKHASCTNTTGAESVRMRAFKNHYDHARVARAGLRLQGAACVDICLHVALRVVITPWNVLINFGMQVNCRCAYLLSHQIVGVMSLSYSCHVTRMRISMYTEHCMT